MNLSFIFEPEIELLKFGYITTPKLEQSQPILLQAEVKVLL